MAERTLIEWAHHTWNPWRGCQHATLPGTDTPHPGCLNCYAEAGAARNPTLLGHWGADGTRAIAAERTFTAPQRWNEKAREANERRVVFVNSYSDFFEDFDGEAFDHDGCAHYTDDNDPETMFRNCQMVGDTDGYHYTELTDARARAYRIIDRCDWLDFLILTKRPQNAPRLWLSRCHRCDGDPRCDECRGMGMHRPNVWLLYSASDQDSLDAGLPYLLDCRPFSPVLGLSLEPLIAPVEIPAQPCPDCNGRGHHGQAIHGLGVEGLRGKTIECERCNGRGTVCPIDWLIIGGESGPHARPCRLEWIEAAISQAVAAGLPVFLKQLGAYSIRGTTAVRHATRSRKGGDPAEWPEYLRQYRQFPTTQR